MYITEDMPIVRDIPPPTKEHILNVLEEVIDDVKLLKLDAGSHGKNNAKYDLVVKKIRSLVKEIA